MTTLRIKRALTTAQREAYTGPQGELVYDVTERRVYIQDGSTPGGVIIHGYENERRTFSTPTGSELDRGERAFHQLWNVGWFDQGVTDTTLDWSSGSSTLYTYDVVVNHNPSGGTTDPDDYNTYRCIKSHDPNAAPGTTEPGVGTSWEDYWVIVRSGTREEGGDATFTTLQGMRLSPGSVGSFTWEPYARGLIPAGSLVAGNMIEVFNTYYCHKDNAVDSLILRSGLCLDWDATQLPNVAPSVWTEEWIGLNSYDNFVAASTDYMVAGDYITEHWRIFALGFRQFMVQLVYGRHWRMHRNGTGTDHEYVFGDELVGSVGVQGQYPAGGGTPSGGPTLGSEWPEKIEGRSWIHNWDGSVDHMLYGAARLNDNITPSVDPAPDSDLRLRSSIAYMVGHWPGGVGPTNLQGTTS